MAAPVVREVEAAAPSPRRVVPGERPLVSPQTESPSMLLQVGLFVAYLLSRIPLLDRELTFEEPLFSVPGLNLFSGKGYFFYGGEFDPHMSAFHKPPLLTFLVGLMTSVFGTGTVAMRFTPLLLGAVTFCLFLAILREIRAQILPAALVYITFPFLVVGANQIQTDGSVGILGYLLVTLGSLRLVRAERLRSALLLIAGGTMWLSIAKAEILVFSLATIFVAFCFSLRRVSWWKPVVAVVAGISMGQLALLGFSYAVLGSSAGFFEVYGVPINIITSLYHSKQAQQVAQSAGQSWEFLEWMLRWYIPEAVLAALIFTGLNFVLNRREPLLRKQLLVLCASVAVPSFIYLVFTYAGDGFPRYLLIVIPASIAVIAAPVPGRTLNAFVSLTLVGLALYQLPRLEEIYRSRVSFTGYGGQGGFQQAGDYLESRLAENDVILAPDPVGFYYGRKYYDPALIEAFPTRYEQLVNGDVAKSIRAWVFFDSGNEEYPAAGRLRKLYDRFKAECRLDGSTKIGTLRVLFLKEKGDCRVPPS